MWAWGGVVAGGGGVTGGDGDYRPRMPQHNAIMTDYVFNICPAMRGQGRVFFRSPDWLLPPDRT